MVQNAKRKPTIGRKIKDQQGDIQNLYNLARNTKLTSAVSLPAQGTASVNQDNTVNNSDYLSTNGGVMRGPISFNPATEIIDSDGHIDINPSSTPTTPRNDTTYMLAVGAGSPDDLNFIDGAQYNGQYLVLQGTATQVINLIHAILIQGAGITEIVGVGGNIVRVTTTAVHNLTTGQKINMLATTNFNAQNKAITVTSTTIFTYDLGSTASTTPETNGTVQLGNIFTPDGVDVQLDGTVATNAIPAVTLIFDITLAGFGGWRIISGAGATSTTYLIDDQGNKGGVTVTHDLSINTKHDLVFTATGAITLAFSNYPVTGTGIDWYVEITQDGTGGHVITFPSEVVNAPVIVTTADTTSLVALHTHNNGTTVRAITLLSASPSSGFSGNLSDLTIDTDFDANGVRKFILDADADTYLIGDTDDRIEFFTAGTEKLRLDTELQLQGGVNLDVNGNELVLDADGDTSIKASTDDIMVFKAGGTDQLDIRSTGLVMQGSMAWNTTSQTLDLNSNTLILDLDGDTSIDAASDDIIDFNMGGQAGEIIFQNQGEILWGRSGVQHKITPSATSVTITTGVNTDNFTLQFTDSAKTTVFTDNHEIQSSDASAYTFESNFSKGTPANDDVFALYQWNFKNDIGTVEPHAEMRMTCTDVTDGTEDSDIDFLVFDAGSFINIMRLDGSGNQLLMVAQGNIDLNTGSLERVTDIDMENGGSINFETSTGTKIGSSATQKLAFWNTTPVVQPAHIADATDAADVITRVNLILAQMATTGLQAAS